MRHLLSSPESSSRGRGISATCVSALLAVTSLLLVSCGPSARAASVAPDAPIPISPSDTGFADLALDPNSGTGFSVWSTATGSRTTGVFGQRTDLEGRPIGDAIRLSDDGDTGARSPQVAYSFGSRNFLIVWRSAGTEPSGAVIRGRRVSANAVPVDKRVATFGSGGADLDLAAGRRGFLLTYSRGGRVYARAVSSDGLSKSPHLVARAALIGCGLPAVASRSRSDEYLVAFSCGLPDDGQAAQTQFVRRVGRTGVPRAKSLVVIEPRDTNRGKGDVALTYNAQRDQFLFVGAALRATRVRVISGRGDPAGPVRTLRRRSYQFEGGSPGVGFSTGLRRYVVAWRAYRRIGRGEAQPALFVTSLSERGRELGKDSLLWDGVGQVVSVASRPGAGRVLVGFATGGRNFVRSVEP